jgi:aryl-alcohol dehydrogenase-like predicted oxidoreductase
LAFKDVTERESLRTIHAAIDAGISLIDTAIAYTRPGNDSYAESLIRKALSTRRASHVLVATKGGHWRSGDEFPVDGSPLALRRHCELSLKSINRDRIDLYQLHQVDPVVPLAESVNALADLQREGKVDLIGLSNVSETQIAVASRVARISSVQNRASLDHRDNLSVARYCSQHGILFMAYMPFEGSGRTSKTYAASVSTIAAAHQVSRHRVALAGLMALGSNILPLVGATRPASIRDSAAAGDLSLSIDELVALGIPAPRAE